MKDVNTIGKLTLLTKLSEYEIPIYVSVFDDHVILAEFDGKLQTIYLISSVKCDCEGTVFKLPKDHIYLKYNIDYFAFYCYCGSEISLVKNTSEYKPRTKIKIYDDKDYESEYPIEIYCEDYNIDHVLSNIIEPSIKFEVYDDDEGLSDT